MREYHVRKDHTINYKSNYYSVPTGTYQGIGTIVFVEVVEKILNIYDKESGKTITSHTLCVERGKHIVNNAHKQDRSIGIDKLEEKILSYQGMISPDHSLIANITIRLNTIGIT